MNDSLYAFQDWVRATRDPVASWHEKMSAFNHYTESLKKNQSQTLIRKRDWNRQSSWLELKDRLLEILQDWIDRIEMWFRAGRTPSETELDRFERQVADEMEASFEALADDVYRDAMEDAAEEIDGFTPQFGGRHERALQTLTERSTVPETFATLSEETGNVLVEELEASFERGEANIQDVVNRTVERFGVEVAPAAETIARSESWKVWQQSKYETYREAEERREEVFKVEFIRDLGPTPRGNPQCDVCTEIIKRTKGGVTLEELNDIIVEVSTDPKYGGSPSWDPLRDSDIGLPHPNCMTGDMEVLTREGWKRFDECRGDEIVATMDLNTEAFEWQEPDEFIAQDADMVYDAKNTVLDFSVTPDHDMLYRTSGGITKAPASHMADLVNSNIPSRNEAISTVGPRVHELTPAKIYSNRWRTKYEWRHTSVPVEDWAKFLGIFLAEGSTSSDKHYYRIRIASTKEEQVEAVEELLDRLPWEYKKVPNGHQITCKQLWQELRPLGKAHEKYVPEYVFDWSAEDIETLLEWYHKGDGSARTGKGEGNWRFWTVSEQLADDVQALMQMIGRSSSKRCNIRKNVQMPGGAVCENPRPLYSVNERASRNRSIRGECFELREHNGRVYCFSVPNGTLLVRRDGKPFWIGNCRHTTSRVQDDL